MFEFEFKRDVFLGVATAFGVLCIVSAFRNFSISEGAHTLFSDYGAVVAGTLAALGALMTVNQMQKQIQQQQDFFYDEKSANSRLGTLLLLRTIHVLVARRAVLKKYIDQGQPVTAQKFNWLPKPPPISDAHYGGLKSLRGSDGASSLAQIDLFARQGDLPPSQVVDLEIQRIAYNHTALAIYLTSQMYLASWTDTYSSDKKRLGKTGKEFYTGVAFTAFATRVCKKKVRLIWRH